MKKILLTGMLLISPCELAVAGSDVGMWSVAAVYLCVAQYPAYADLPAIRADEGGRSMLREMDRLRAVFQQCQRDRPTPLPLLPLELCDATMAHLSARAAEWDPADDFGMLIKQRYEPAIQQWLDCIQR